MTIKWDFTAVSDFDSIRGIRATDYMPYLDLMENLKVKNLDGAFAEFKYDLRGGTLNGDYLKILTVERTDVSLEFHLDDILPGRYLVSINALLRVVDGVTYDAYLNGSLVSSGNNLNGGLYRFETRELGIAEIQNKTGNIFRIDIKDGSSLNKYCHIDYLLFEPHK